MDIDTAFRNANFNEKTIVKMIKEIVSIKIDDMTKVPLSELQAESRKMSRAYREITANYAEKCGWYRLLCRTESDLDLKQALQGWKAVVKKIGKGTGKNAPMYKAEARRLMALCQRAVPAWIMPIYKAMDNLNPAINSFDIVIVDDWKHQASVCG